MVQKYYSLCYRMTVTYLYIDMAALIHYGLLCIPCCAYITFYSYRTTGYVSTLSKYSGGDRQVGYNKVDRAIMGFRDYVITFFTLEFEEINGITLNAECKHRMLWREIKTAQVNCGSGSATLQVYDHVPMDESALQTLKIDVLYFFWELQPSSYQVIVTVLWMTRLLCIFSRLFIMLKKKQYYGEGQLNIIQRKDNHPIMLKKVNIVL